LQAIPIGARSYLQLDSIDPSTWLAGAAAGAALPAAGTAVTVEICRGDQVDRVMSDLAIISDDWLEAQDLRERHAICGHFSRDYVAHCPVAILRHDGRIVAFAVLWSAPGQHECEIDLLRWSPAAPADAPYQLLAGILIWAKAVGFQQLDLGLTPSPEEADSRLIPLWHELVWGQRRQPPAAGEAPPATIASLLLKGSSALPLSSEISYLLYPMGLLAQSQRDLINLINRGH
jgi:hypothetical protein